MRHIGKINLKYYNANRMHNMNDDLIKALDQVVSEIKSMTPAELNDKLEEHKDTEFAQTVQLLYNVANSKPLDKKFATLLNDNILDLF